VEGVVSVEGEGEVEVEVEVEVRVRVRVAAEVDVCFERLQWTREPPIGVGVVAVVVVRWSMTWVSNGSKVAFQMGLGIESCGRSGHSR